VALTGGIATGKSYCLSRFAAMGVPVIDADGLAREAVAPGTAGLAAVAARFGHAVLARDGSLDRPALARIVFSNDAARADLEALLHPEVYRRILDWFANQPPGTPFAVADIPLLFETGHEHDFDRVVVTWCDPSEQLRRLVERDGLSPAAARARLDAQWPTEEKASRAHYVIRTDGSFADTDDQLRRLVETLKAGGLEESSERLKFER
jgi:dephospho-CoA kinase